MLASKSVDFADVVQRRAPASRVGVGGEPERLPRRLKGPVVEPPIQEEVAPWEGWGNLFLDGVRVLVVGVAFVLAPALLHWLGAGEVLTVLAFGVAATLQPMALVRVASSGRLGAAFEIGKVWQDVRLLFSGYFPAVLAWLAALFAYGLLLVGSRWPLAWMLHGFVGFYLYLFFAALFGRVGSRTRMLRLTYR